MPPLRTIITLAVVLAVAVMAIWTAVALPRLRILPRPLGMALTVVVVAALMAAIAWLVFVLPAYWD